MLVALSGHGLSFECWTSTGRRKDESFFCPADAKPRKTGNLKELSTTMLGFTGLFGSWTTAGWGRSCCWWTPAATSRRVSQQRRGHGAAAEQGNGGAVQLQERRAGVREGGKLKHGIFFHFVLQGLKGKARNEDGEVTWDRLTEYVKRQVSRESPKLISGGGRQTPHGDQQHGGRFPGAANHRADPRRTRWSRDGRRRSTTASA